MKIVLRESHCKKALMPFTAFRHTCDIRIGMITIREKWKLLFPDADILDDTELDENEKCVVIPANLIPSPENAQDVLNHYKTYKSEDDTNTSFKKLMYPWEICQFSDSESRSDFPLLRASRIQSTDFHSAKLIGNDIFIEAGARISHCILNSETGPIFISSDSEIMEGATIRGPFFMDEKAVVKMGARIYGSTSIGRKTVIGGEVKNAVIFEHSQKAHEGYLGDSVIGSWCNIGAGTSNSNVKNTFGEVFYQTNDGISTISAGKKAGLIMGDFSKCAINSSFYTGSYVGVCCNLFGSDVHEKYITDFTWGKSKYHLEKLLQHINAWRINTGNPALDFHETEKIKQLYKSSI